MIWLDEFFIGCVVLDFGGGVGCFVVDWFMCGHMVMLVDFNA